jgi:hypothetical protein
MSLELNQEFFKKLSSLPVKTQREVFKAIGEREFLRCADDPVYWLDHSLHPRTHQHPGGIPYVYTKDPHLLYTCIECDMEVLPTNRGNHLEISHGKVITLLRELEKEFVELPAIRPFPLFLLKEYMVPIIEEWLKAQCFVLEKSRDMMATWLFVALHTWMVAFHKGRQALFQSQTAPKTLELVQRAHFILRQHPKFLREAVGQVVFGKGDHRSGELFILDQESEILGFAQGSDQVRQFHPTAILTDETAFQPEAEAGFAAIKPAILMGGRYTGISSANRSWFERVCRDLSDD